MEPSAHQPALFLIHTGISDTFEVIEEIFPDAIIKEEVLTVDLEFPY